MQKSIKKKINWPEMMIEFGKECANSWIKKILLYWDLWAGKTHFAKWFFGALGIEEWEICSPTYTYVNQYSEEKSHFDLYRLENFQDFVWKGLFDILNQSEFIIIERPKREEEYLDEDFTKIYIQKTSPTQRTVEIS